MALGTFWEIVRQRNPLFRERLSPPDVPRVTVEELDVKLTTQDVWRTLGVFLPGYNEADFDFLPEYGRHRLTELVSAFNSNSSKLREAGQQVPPDEATFADLTVRARSLLRDIILLLEQDRYRTADAFRYGKLVERELGDSLLEGVVELRFYAGEDSAGEPAIWVWAFLSDEATATDDMLVETGRRVRPILRAAARTAAPDHYPYILFRGISERVEAEVAA